jgi:hypothetical protein
MSEFELAGRAEKQRNPFDKKGHAKYASVLHRRRTAEHMKRGILGGEVEGGQVWEGFAKIGKWKS